MICDSEADVEKMFCDKRMAHFILQALQNVVKDGVPVLECAAQVPGGGLEGE